MEVIRTSRIKGSKSSRSRVVELVNLGFGGLEARLEV